MNPPSSEIGVDEDDAFLVHLPSPQQKPTAGPKPPGLVPTGGQFSPGGLGGLGSKKGLGMGKKVFSMMDLSAAAEESEMMGSPLPTKNIFKPGSKTSKPLAAPPPADDDDDIGVDSDQEGDDDDEDEFPKQLVLEHTVGRPRQGSGMKRSQSEVFLNNPGLFSPMASIKPKQVKTNMLVVFDMDHTMVGDLVSLSDRDNIETNVPWKYWPEGKDRGLRPDYIHQYLKRGMMRPGMIDLINYLEQIGATIVVYTHSEEKWASKVCEAMEKMVGWNFVKRLFSRNDCRDGHPEFTARKSLEFVINECIRLDGLTWASYENTIFFDDDGNAVNGVEQPKLVKVASYDYWEPCQWDEVVNEAMMSRNPPDLADMVRRSVVEWGIACPSYGKSNRNVDDVKRDARWALQRQQKQQILMSYNKVAKLDRVMIDIREVMAQYMPDMESLPERIRVVLGKSQQPASRRQKA